MTDNILSQSEGSANPPGQGGRMHGGKSFSDTDRIAAKAAPVTPEAPADIRRGWRRTMTGLVCLIAAAGVGFLIYQSQDVHRIAKANAAATRTSDETQVNQSAPSKRTEAQTHDLDVVRREMETQTTARLADDAAREAAERSAAELEQALKQERDKAEKLARELAATRRVLETQATTVRGESGAKPADNQELAILKRALQEAETSTAAYQELLAQERARNQSLEQQLLARRETAPDPKGSDTAEGADSSGATPTVASDRPSAVAPSAEDKPLIVASADDRSATTAAPQPAVSGGGNPEADRLVARANQLLIVGDVAAARIVLDRAAELGDARALFTLAETYDPLSLSAWGTLGTQGDAAKARELYAKAFAGGVQEAKDRMNALRE
ncbi:hypothetical protein [Enhydrobacter sp.]|jgi:chemotaxis protein histidine kinase CheA|uniref:hypothetical protein n=1 Tax=Enhydrobacter sp. TaxID=1894999 RepID=UPI002637A78E|nr:hypothetical protein [Enhydrobacter sp.]WIM09967.1 MAG: hypothetical protein OJF58_000920 [Enhydrobacter sp.]